MEMKQLMCYSKHAYNLKITSILVFICGIIAYIAAFVNICTVQRSYSSEFEFSFIALFIALPVLIGFVFLAYLGLCVADIAQNSAQKSAYLTHKAEEENIYFKYD